MKSYCAIPFASLLLSACISLPENQQQLAHYKLVPPPPTCQTDNGQTIRFNVAKVNAALNHNRLVHINNLTGEVKYLQGLEWPADSRELIEQQLAIDLENSGFNVITSHHQTASMASLICELRAFQLESSDTQTQANFNISCRYKEPQLKTYKNIKASEHTIVQGLSKPMVIKALSESYQNSYHQLCEALIQP